MQPADITFVNRLSNPRMAINIDSARFLLASRRRGVSFNASLTLGRQELYLSHREIRTVLREFDLDPDHYPRLFGPEYPAYAEPFWETLGAHRNETLDASPYENASIVHDLNQPIPPHLQRAFDTVCDGGTLEHVFDFPTALRNSLEMVRPGGHFLAISPGNNLLGHGFYQLSPELFFRVLSPDNGFQIEALYALETGWRRRWFAISDPANSNTRVSLINHLPVLLYVRARRLSPNPIPPLQPQQSDYLSRWNAPPTPTTGAPATALIGRKPGSPALRRRLLEIFPTFARRCEVVMFSSLNRAFSFRNRHAFHPINPHDL
jgi:SAM-dependent methyltransferase